MSAMIHIHGPENGNFIAQFVTADGRSLAIIVPGENAAVLRDLQELIPYGVALRDIDAASCEADAGAAAARDDGPHAEPPQH
jgi:hypothetical protein